MTGRLALFALGFITSTALSSAGCATPARAPAPTTCLLYRLDRRFDKAERIEIGKAAASWRAMGACIAEGNGDVFVFRDTHATDIPKKHKSKSDDPDTLAFWATAGRDIHMFMDRIPPERFRVVMTHEFGHALGGQHVTNMIACLFPRVTDWCAMADGPVLQEDFDAITPSYRVDP